MRRPICVFVVLSALAACDSLQNRAFPRTAPSAPAQPAQTPAPPPPVIQSVTQLGQDFSGIFNRPWLFYELTPPKDGVLVLRLRWDANDTKLIVAVDDTVFSGSPPDYLSPVTGHVAVSAGRKYLVKIDRVSPWD
jgi:hypothetical protein